MSDNLKKKKDIEIISSDAVSQATTESNIETEDDKVDDQIVSGNKNNIVNDNDIDPERYFETVGRRKESVARVRLFTRKSSDGSNGNNASILINEQNHGDYIKDPELVTVVESPLRRLKSINRFKATVKVKGGGIRGQADAIRHGISRALVLFDENFSKKLKKAGFLTRDPRVKERKKFGLKKARKSPQWSKR